MPSRKKAQGQARKARKCGASRAYIYNGAEARNNLNPNNGVSGGCIHISERHWSRDDWSAVHDLYFKYRGKCAELSKVFRNESYIQIVSYWAHLTYDKYRQFSDTRKDLFRKYLLAMGTEYCVTRSNVSDLTKESVIEGIYRYLVMIKTIEIRDRLNGESDLNITELEIRISLNDIIACPRQSIRLFHRQNSCDCLQEIYIN
eukprot:scaffold28929_cov71-Cyclotella_meneghiniana.AAC.7